MESVKTHVPSLKLPHLLKSHFKSGVECPQNAKFNFTAKTLKQIRRLEAEIGIF